MKLLSIKSEAVGKLPIWDLLAMMHCTTLVENQTAHQRKDLTPTVKVLGAFWFRLRLTTKCVETVAKLCLLLLGLPAPATPCSLASAASSPAAGTELNRPHPSAVPAPMMTETKWRQVPRGTSWEATALWERESLRFQQQRQKENVKGTSREERHRTLHRPSRSWMRSLLDMPPN